MEGPERRPRSDTVTVGKKEERNNTDLPKARAQLRTKGANGKINRAWMPQASSDVTTFLFPCPHDTSGCSSFAVFAKGGIRGCVSMTSDLRYQTSHLPLCFGFGCWLSTKFQQPMDGLGPRLKAKIVDLLYSSNSTTLKVFFRSVTSEDPGRA